MNTIIFPYHALQICGSKVKNKTACVDNKGENLHDIWPP